MTSSKLIEEIRRSGFLLEWRTADILRNNGFYVEQNLLLETALHSSAGETDRLVEVDVFAFEKPAHEPGNAYIVECKGAASVDKLVLLPTPDVLNSIPTVYFDFESKQVMFDAQKNITSENHPQSTLFCCHSGDFFALNNKDGGFSKASRQDEKNNLFRGIQQLHSALDALLMNYGTALTVKILPMIVTNAEIYVAMFDLSQASDRHIDIQPVPWAAYRNPMIYPKISGTIGCIDWKYLPNSAYRTESYVRQRRIPFVWIVNVENLENFILSSGKRYRRRP